MSMPPRSRTGSGPLVAGLLIVLAIVIALIALAAAGVTPQQLWDGFFPIENQTPVTDRSLNTKWLYDVVFYIAAAIFFIVEGLIIYAAFRYRRKPGDNELPPQTHGNNLVEIVWTLIPTVIVAVLFVLSWQTLNTVEAKANTTVHVQAIAARFQWQFVYLDGDGKPLFTQSLPVRSPTDPQATGGGMFLPVGEPVQVDLRSEDVIHAFYVPKFLFKRDVVPGKLNTFDFTVEEAGTYRGQCAELCGTFHGSMVFDVHAVDRPTFDAWVAEQIDKALATPPPPPSGAPEGAVVPLSAQNVAFSTSSLQAPKDQPFTIDFKNDDASVPHNVEIQDPTGAVAFKGDIITGVAETQYAVSPLAAGDYKFFCTVHPNMTGILTVQ
jgi:cytochrome c oxidase subunit 2